MGGRLAGRQEATAEVVRATKDASSRIRGQAKGGRYRNVLLEVVSSDDMRSAVGQSFRYYGDDEGGG
jgi:hypothetical protein